MSEKNKSESVNEWKLLKEASKEVESWPSWMQKNAELLFGEEQEKQRKTKEKKEGRMNRTKGCILLVDDEQDILKALSNIFKAAKYTVIMANGGKEAFNLLKQNGHIDVILSDIRMPDGNGIDFFRNAHRYAPHVPFFFMSANNSVLKKDLQRLGVKRLFTKPFDTKGVIAAIKRAVYLSKN